MRSWAVCLLLIAAAVGSALAQQGNCLDLFSALTPADAREAIVRDCTGSQLSCGACQCSLVRAITPRLVQSGKVLSSEAWMPASLATIADSLTACRREFSVQLLENTNATLSELASLDSCSTDVKAVSQCMRAQPGAAASGATAVPRAASGSDDMAGEVLAEACAAAVSGSGNAADCPSPAAAQVVAGVPLLSGGGMVFAPVSDASVLRISAANTRGTTTWRAFCYCDDTWDPVCDGNTRKQYPNGCSARCQNVTSVVSCSALEPLVNQTMAGNTAVFVVDESLMRAAAFAGPVPPEASEDPQNFYYYYEDDADDTNDALEIASTLAEAFLAARMGEEVEAIDAVVRAVPAAMQASVSRANVTAADGPAAAAAPAAGTGPLAALRNITISRQRRGLGGRQGAAAAAAAPQRRNVSVATGMATMPAPPFWMATSAPGYSAGVYQRDADRTSRILASLMAAAQEAGKAAPAAPVAPRLPMTFTLPRVGGLGGADSNTPAGLDLGGLLRSALPAVSNVTARVNGTIANMTSALDDMMGNATANGTAALRAFGGLAQNPTSTVASGLGGLLQRLRTAVQQAAADRPAATAFQGVMTRSAMNAMNATLDSAMNATMNGTSAGNGTSARNSTASQRGSMPKRHFMFL